MSQALEMAQIYTNILSSTLDAFASIIANNQNLVLKRLAGITIILQFPVLVASIYGMNVPIPFSETKYAFYVPILLALGIFYVASSLAGRSAATAASTGVEDVYWKEE